MKSHFGLEEDIAEHLLRYGIHYTCICELIDQDPDRKARISLNRPYILAEIDYHIFNEKALSLRDVMFRRTQIQLSENQGFDCVDKIARRMGDILNWDSAEINTEIQQYKDSLSWQKI